MAESFSIANGSGAGAREPSDATAGGPVAAADAPVTGLVFILSGPSGVGKDTITKCLKDSRFPLGYCVTATTRRQRPGEVDGVSYYFLSEEEFAALEAADGLLEHAVVHGKRYGIPIEGLRAGLRTGHDVLVTPDVQGAATLRAKLPHAITIFLAPPTLEELVPRLANRGSETPEERAVRLATAEREMQRVDEYDYVVVNERGRVYESVEKIKAIITAERCRVNPRLVTL
jgi:guanylate kinase